MEKQEVFLIREANTKVEKMELPSNTLYTASEKMISAWELDGNQQGKNKKTGKYVQVVSERSKRPLTVYPNRGHLKGNSTDTISSQKTDEALTFMNTHNHRSSQLMWLGILAAIIFVVVGLIVLLNMNKVEAAALLPVLGILAPKKAREALKTIADVEKLLKKEAGTVNCIVFYEEDKTYEENVPIDRVLIPDDSMEREYRGKPCHMLTLSGGKFLAIEPENEIKENDMPPDLYDSLDCEQDMTTLFGATGGWTEKIKLGVFVALCAGGMIILFIIATIAMG